MDPIRNPYAPGAGQRPPELAGRDEQLAAFDVVLERVAKGRPERSLVLTGLRGVGKTVLLNALRGTAVRKGWGTGKLEARPGQGLRRPLSSALHQAVRELGHSDPDSVDHVLGVIKSFAHRDAGTAAKLKDQWSPGIDAPAGGAEREQVLQRAALPLPAHRPALPRGGRPRPRGAGARRGRGLRA